MGYKQGGIIPGTIQVQLMPGEDIQKRDGTLWRVVTIANGEARIIRVCPHCDTEGITDGSGCCVMNGRETV